MNDYFDYNLLIAKNLDLSNKLDQVLKDFELKEKSFTKYDLIKKLILNPKNYNFFERLNNIVKAVERKKLICNDFDKIRENNIEKENMYVFLLDLLKHCDKIQYNWNDLFLLLVYEKEYQLDEDLKNFTFLKN